MVKTKIFWFGNLPNEGSIQVWGNILAETMGLDHSEANQLKNPTWSIISGFQLSFLNTQVKL